MKSFILWDHDGVLVDTEPWYFEATRRIIAELGVELRLPGYQLDMASGRSAWHRAAALGVSGTAIEAHKQRRNALYQQFLVSEDIEIPGVSEILEALATSYRMAVVTTAKRPDFELIHRNRDIVAHMEFVLMKGDYAHSKPSPDPYLAALERFDADPSEAIVVEDSERGLRAALAAKIDCVVVANAFVQGQDLSAAQYHIDSLAELPGLMSRL